MKRKLNISYAEKAQKEFSENQIKVHRQIDKLPEDQKDMVYNTARLVENTILEVEEGIRSGESYKLHEQMKKFFNVHRLKDSDKERELFQKVCSESDIGKIFAFRSKYFINTFDGQLLSANDYIYILEKAIMNEKESYENLCTYLTLKDTFKLLMHKIKGVFNGK